MIRGGCLCDGGRFEIADAPPRFDEPALVRHRSDRARRGGNFDGRR
jgi:hypothetical protein